MNSKIRELDPNVIDRAASCIDASDRGMPAFDHIAKQNAEEVAALLTEATENGASLEMQIMQLEMSLEARNYDKKHINKMTQQVNELISITNADDLSLNKSLFLTA